MGYYNNYLVDNHSCIVVGVQATGARLSEESRAGREMIARFAQWQGRKPESIAADASYGNGEFLQWLVDREITPYMPTRDAVGRTRSPFYGPELFTYLPESDSYICPAGQQLNMVAATKGIGHSVISERARNAVRARKGLGARPARSGILPSI